MHIQQFYDTFLAHASYAVISGKEVVLIDPARDPQPYYDFAAQHGATIVAVIETHPHADFISSHTEIAGHTGAKIYVSKLLGATYPHTAFDDGGQFKAGNITFHAMNTPGHSPDSISVVLKDEQGKEQAVFTGDTLFIGDVGRPDLRENVGALQQKREELAKAMYASLREKLMKLPPDTIVYPAHGAGSLCGKNLSKETQSTIGRELATNYALQPMTEEEFVKVLLADQPFIPKYFGFAVDLNKQGAAPMEQAIARIPRLRQIPGQLDNALLIDSRDQEAFRKGHAPFSINNLIGNKFETWLGSIVSPTEKFYLIAATDELADALIRRICSIGYEQNLLGVIVSPHVGNEKSDELNLGHFDANKELYTIVDIRNKPEVEALKIFQNSIHIPLYELRERAKELPRDKPLMVHCAGGYRSAIGSSIIKNELQEVQVYDLGPVISDYAQKALTQHA